MKTLHHHLILLVMSTNNTRQMKGGRDETRQHNARASSLFSSFVNCAAVYIYYATKGSHCLQVFIAKHCRCLFVALALAFLLFPVLLSDFIHESLEFNDPSLPFHWRKAIEWKLGELASNYNALSASLSMLVLYPSQATKLYYCHKYSHSCCRRHCCYLTGLVLLVLAD